MFSSKQHNWEGLCDLSQPFASRGIMIMMKLEMIIFVICIF
jgi:hypothetical protein